MIGLDTNVLVRYIVRDDPFQARAATKLIETRCTTRSPGRISIVVLCELVWVLGRGYGYSREQIADVMRRLLAANDLQVEQADLAWQALGFYERGKADFADYVIGLSNSLSQAEPTYTFDKRAGGHPFFKVLDGK